jgi:RimJ/RimL family protein N-acetyltransferase
MAEDKSGYPTQSTLVGEKIFLRPSTKDDLVDAHFWLTQSDPDAVFNTMTRIVPASDASDLFRRKRKTDMDSVLTIVGKKEEDSVGIISFYNFNGLNRSAEINVLIDPDKRKKGLARDALKTLTSYLFLQRGLNKVYAQVADFNAPGKKLFETLGFKKDGKLRAEHFYQGEFHDTIVYSLLRFELDW